MLRKVQINPIQKKQQNHPVVDAGAADVVVETVARTVTLIKITQQPIMKQLTRMQLKTHRRPKQQIQPKPTTLKNRRKNLEHLQENHPLNRLRKPLLMNQNLKSQMLKNRVEDANLPPKKPSRTIQKK